jgi:hypothetical protein
MDKDQSEVGSMIKNIHDYFYTDKIDEAQKELENLSN